MMSDGKVDRAPRTGFRERAGQFFDAYKRIPASAKISAGVAANVASGGLWGLVGAGIAGYAAYEAVDGWATKSSAEVKRGRWLHAQLARRKWLRKTAAIGAGIGTAAAAYFVGDAIGDAIGGVSEAHAAVPQATVAELPIPSEQLSLASSIEPAGESGFLNDASKAIVDIIPQPVWDAHDVMDKITRENIGVPFSDALGAASSAGLLYSGALDAFSRYRSPRKISATAALSLTGLSLSMLFAQQYLTAATTLGEALLYYIGWARGPGQTGKD